MSNRDRLLGQLESNDRYQKILGAADGQVREHIERMIVHLMGNIGSDIDDLEKLLSDPEVRGRFVEMLRGEK